MSEDKVTEEDRILFLLKIVMIIIVVTFLILFIFDQSFRMNLFTGALDAIKAIYSGCDNMPPGCI